MQNRVATIFALLAIAMLGLGIAASKWATFTGFSFTSRGIAHFLPFEVPCYALAAWFCLCALRYALYLLPASRSMSKWHVWMTTGGVIVALLGWAGTAWQNRQGPPLYASDKFMLASLIALTIAGPAVLAIAQLFLLFGFRGILRVLRANAP